MATVIFEDIQSFFCELECLLFKTPDLFDCVRIYRIESYDTLLCKPYIFTEAAVIDSNGTCYKVSHSWPAVDIGMSNETSVARSYEAGNNETHVQPWTDIAIVNWIDRAIEKSTSLGLRLASGKLARSS